MLLLGDAVSIISHGLWGSAAAPKDGNFAAKPEHSCCLSVTVQFVLFLPNKACGVARASGACPCEGQWDAAQGHLPSTSQGVALLGEQQFHCAGGTGR